LAFEGKNGLRKVYTVCWKKKKKRKTRKKERKKKKRKNILLLLLSKFYLGALGRKAQCQSQGR
jgi:hypothetical protein